MICGFRVRGSRHKGEHVARSAMLHPLKRQPKGSDGLQTNEPPSDTV